MDKNVRVGLLLDFYGQLITQRQREFLEEHYQEDLSLAESAQVHGVSRQAVQDGIRRGQAQLEGFEESLGLVRRHLRQQKSLEKLVRQWNKLRAAPRDTRAWEDMQACIDTIGLEEESYGI